MKHRKPIYRRVTPEYYARRERWITRLCIAATVAVIAAWIAVLSLRPWEWV